MLTQIGRLGGDLEKIAIVAIVVRTRAGGAFSPPIDVSRENVRLRRILGARLLGGRLKGGRRLAVHMRRGWRNLAVGVFALEERIFREKFLELLVQFHRRELQQTYRLLQLRRQRQVLRELEL